MSPISHLVPTDFQTVPHRLIHFVFYDLVLQEEIETAWKIEKQGAVIDLVSISTWLPWPRRFPTRRGWQPGDPKVHLCVVLEASINILIHNRFHQFVAPELFLGAFIPSASEKQGRRLIGYTFATLSPIPRYTQTSLTTHVPDATTVCSHTLCVDSDFRGASVGLKLFAEFIDRCRKKGKYDRMVFMAKENLVPVYEKMGIILVGKAEVALGKDVWFEMCMSFRENSWHGRDSSALFSGYWWSIGPTLELPVFLACHLVLW